MSAGIADPKQAFNPSDAILDANIPRSRLITGLRAGHCWVVAVERGGFSYGTEILKFNTAEAEAQRITWLRTPPASIEICWHSCLIESSGLTWYAADAEVRCGIMRGTTAAAEPRSLDRAVRE